MARKAENIVYDPSARDIPLYPCWGSEFMATTNLSKDKKVLFRKDVEYEIVGMSNGVWVSGIRKKWWLIKIKHDEDVNAFFVKESDVQKLYNKGLLI